WYTEQILNAGCAMVNCMPVFIAKGGYFGRQFEERGLPIIGDDIKAQVGATITHRVLTTLFRERGVKVDRTFQLNFGGNSDFLNMLERDAAEADARRRGARCRRAVHQAVHPPHRAGQGQGVGLGRKMVRAGSRPALTSLGRRSPPSLAPISLQAMEPSPLR